MTDQAENKVIPLTHVKESGIMSHFERARQQPEMPWVHDVINGDGGSKLHHRWEQGVDGAANLIKGLTYPGNLICDPFIGSGTTAVACKKLDEDLWGVTRILMP